MTPEQERERIYEMLADPSLGVGVGWIKFNQCSGFLYNRKIGDHVGMVYTDQFGRLWSEKEDSVTLVLDPRDEWQKVKDADRLRKEHKMPGPRPATFKERLESVRRDWRKARPTLHIGGMHTGMDVVDKVNEALDFQIRVIELMLERLGT